MKDVCIEKKCAQCGEKKSLNFFAIDRRGEFSRRKICLACEDTNKKSRSKPVVVKLKAASKLTVGDVVTVMREAGLTVNVELKPQPYHPVMEDHLL